MKLPHIVFEVTSICNLNCRYCYNIWKRPNAKPVSNNSYSKAKKVLKRLFKIAQVSHLALSGGEPLLAQRFLEIVLFCRMKQKNVTIISNGNMGNRDYFKQLIDLGVSLFELPLHSFDAKTHDYLTRVKGSWQKSFR